MVLTMALVAAGGWLVMLFALAQVIDLMTGWHACMAQVRASDYTEQQQWEDRWLPRMASSRGFNWRDGEDERLIDETIAYTTLDGIEYVTTIERQVVAGWRPDSVYTIWYKDSDPERITLRGPLTWIAVMIAGVAMMATGLHKLAALGGMPVLIAALGHLSH